MYINHIPDNNHVHNIIMSSRFIEPLIVKKHSFTYGNTPFLEVCFDINIDITAFS